MGRGGYDMTDANSMRSSAAMHALKEADERRAAELRKANAEREAEEEAKLIRTKKSRGIMVSRNSYSSMSVGII
ncbi:hypothetical protein P153DRAFT_21141 [Dothidotthia symphoricarpi CBS 119687]|uniref:Uncharacterized protein n=1 Tax=Dothidotthia symphoricarpi CBS 119687 TaxID=1392245 RepID=A0A6A6ACH9_9PLEO|nr:uncharacterized protein P153DRAFT_21141 [Dothidotthia symphoricarpi CBS 119687]KAF2129529.1 hypothetical protein P153DRAFT_21141 [Dothidotthia symphoricarpi CBS 119687]